MCILPNMMCSGSRPNHRVHAIQFAELAAANFLRSIHPEKVAAAKSANADLAVHICLAKTANSERD